MQGYALIIYYKANFLISLFVISSNILTEKISCLIFKNFILLYLYPLPNLYSTLLCYIFWLVFWEYTDEWYKLGDRQ